jgi:rhodanese-related sulfurtransferase
MEVFNMFKFLVKISLLTSLAGLLLTTVATAAMQNISATDLQKLVKQNPDTYLLDVRTLGEYTQKHIKGAHLIPIDQVENRIKEIPQNRPIIVYCETGVRSALVGRYLDRLGYQSVTNLSQGIMGWQVRGYPIESGLP